MISTKTKVNIFARVCVYVCVLRECNGEQIVAGLDMVASKSASQFSAKWLTSPKMYINLMLPTKAKFKIKDVVQLAKKTAKDLERSPYFILGPNMTAHNSDNPSQNELTWFPFDAEKYDIEQLCLRSMNENTPPEKHFLLFTGARQNVSSSFLSSCRIRFDSNVVVYYNTIDTKNVHRINFDEIYKIKAHNERLERNSLGIVDINSQNMDLRGLKRFIWKRRNNLFGTNFNAITEIFPPFITDVEKSRDNDRNMVVYPKGYYADIMKNLVDTLNFTLTTVRSEKYFNHTYMVKSIEEGKYDIGYLMFSFIRGRRDDVDFSYGINDVSFSFFYAKDHKDLNTEAFTKSFKTEAWYSLIIYSIVLIIGFICTEPLTGPHTEHLTIMEVLHSLEKAINFVLRSMIGKRLGSEPTWYSTKIAFFVLVLMGFLLITLYKAILVAFVAIEIENAPVNSLEELRKSNYILAVRKDTSMDKVFLDAAYGSDEYKLQQENKIFRFNSSYLGILDQMTSGENQAVKLLLFYSFLPVQFSEYYPCKVTHIPNFRKYAKNNAGMIYAKNWPYTSLFNYHLLIMKEKGSLDRLFGPYLKGTQKSCPTDQIIRLILKIPDPVSIKTTFSLYLIILTGLVCASIFLCVEIIVKRRNLQ